MAPTPPSGLARRLAANAMHATPARLAALALWLVLTPPIQRALGLEGFAVWSLFFGLTGWLGSLDLGLSSGTLRHVAAARARGDHAAAGAFASLSVLGYVALGAVWLALLPVLREPVIAFLRVPPDVHDSAEFALLAGAVVFTLAGIAGTLISVLQACERFDLGNITALALTGVQAAGIVLSLRTGAGVAGVVLATGCGWAAAVLVGLVALRSGVPDFRWSAPGAAMSQWRATVRFGAPMQLANVLAVTHQQLDKVFLARFVAFPAIAAYELGLRISTAASTFPQLLLLPVTPMAAELHASGEPLRLRELHVRASRYVLVATAAVAAGLIAAAPRLLAAWLGHFDPTAALALRGLAAAAFAALACGAAPAIARALGRTELEAEFSAVALLVHVGLGVWLVPAHGLTGALIALVTGNVLGAGWFLLRLSAVAGWPRMRTLLEPAGVPLLALLAGFSTARLVNGALPVHTGFAAWPAALLVGGLGAGVTAAATLVVRYLSWDEARALLRPRRA